MEHDLEEQQLQEPRMRARQVFARLKALLEVVVDPEEQCRVLARISWRTDTARIEGWNPENWVDHIYLSRANLKENAVEKGESSTELGELMSEFREFAKQQFALRTVSLCGCSMRAERDQKEQKKDKEFFEEFALLCDEEREQLSDAAAKKTHEIELERKQNTFWGKFRRLFS